MATTYVQGWVTSPNGRGTIDILWSCFATVFLCTWPVLNLNVPAEHETWLKCFLRKFRWWLLAMIAPEILAFFAGSQYFAAKRSVDMFHAAGYTDWTLRHGFYANMGGFVLDSPGFPLFPINADHLFGLIEDGYLSFPTLTEKEIGDKSKSSQLSKFLTVSQITWFLLQAFGRSATGLAITTIEISTVAVISCTFCTYFFWLSKPVDVESPTTLKCQTTLAQILIDAGPIAAHPYKTTPLDFEGELFLFSWSMTVLPKFGLRGGPAQRPLPRIPNDIFSDGRITEALLLAFIAVIFPAVHFWGWNLDFASDIERVLWRISSISLLATVALFCLINMVTDWYQYDLDKIVARLKKGSRHQSQPTSDDQSDTAPIETPSRWPSVLLYLLIVILYVLARGYLMIEALTGLRKQPSSAFDTVNWTNSLPHI